MQEISEVLVKARKEKGIDLEQATRDTNISKMFLVGLETDNYEDFPAETYVLGFLRNYATYLGLNPDEIVKLYKQTKLQETDIPQNIILNKKTFNTKPFLVAVGVVLGLALIVFLSIFIWTKLFATKTPATPKENSENKIVEPVSEVISKTENTTYKITEDYFENRFFEGDTFSLKVSDIDYTFKVVKAFSQLELETEYLGTLKIKLGESLQLDLNNDAQSDVQIALGDIDKTDASKGALIVVSTGEKINNTTGNLDVDSTTNKTYKTIFEGASAYPVTMNITFRNYCFFRYEIDQSNRKEQYYQKNASLSIRANNGFRVWASNGNALKIELVGAGRSIDLDITKPGEVLVQDIKWIKDENTNRYKFVVINID